MKKVICVITSICLMLTLAACGKQEQQAASVDVAALYESYQQYLPEMFFPDEQTLLNFLGIQAEDCVQYKVAICAEGLRAEGPGAVRRWLQPHRRIRAEKSGTAGFLRDGEKRHLPGAALRRLYRQLQL